MESESYVVTPSASFANDMTALNNYDYDCLAVDIGLPDGNGLNLIWQLKGIDKSTGLIIISAKDSIDDNLLGLELGSDHNRTDFYVSCKR